jgi:hypothetical protein
MLPLVAGGASAGMMAEPPNGWYTGLPYFQAQYGWFRVVTNQQTFGGVVISNGQSLGTVSPAGQTAEETSGVIQQSLWATKCKKKPQTIELQRTVFLPGAVDKLQASLFAHSNSFSKEHPIKWIGLKVNGTTVYQVGKGGGGPVPDINTRTLVDLNPAGFLYGENTITLVAHKKKTKKPHLVDGKYCTGDNIFGAAAELYGEFTADVSSTIPHGTATTTAAILPVTVTNNGPTDLFPGAGQFSLAVSAPSNTAQITNVIGGVDDFGNAVLSGCTNDIFYSDGHGSGLQTVCPLPHLGPGQSVSFNVLVGHSEVTCPGEGVIYFNYNAPGYLESADTTSNNGQFDREIVCAPS